MKTTDHLIPTDAHVIREVLGILLQDHSTDENIIWATEEYAHLGPEYDKCAQITVDAIDAFGTGGLGLEKLIRANKSRAVQKANTKRRGEVYTPSWVCNLMNNSCDEQWFGRKDVFNTELEDHTWRARPGRIGFSKKPGKTWQDYICSTRIEVSCGEAPYLVSRYDTVTNAPISITKRIGMLDRKLRVVKENVHTKDEWYEWTKKAYQSIYGYEFQGNNLTIARLNLYITFLEHYKQNWGGEPPIEQVREIANIISWNLFQMDGLTYETPYSGYQAQQVIDGFAPQAAPKSTRQQTYAKITNWFDSGASRTLFFREM